MDKLILFVAADRVGLSVIRCSDTRVEKVLARAVSVSAQNIRVIDAVDLDRSFRDAWEDDGGGVKVNMAKARAIHLDRLRERRLRVLEGLDVDWMKALGQKNQTLVDQIEAKRQVLRDMPVLVKSELDSAVTPEMLKLVMPESLK